MRTLIVLAALLFFVPALAVAQSTDQTPRGLGYIFVGPATNHMALTAGFGGEGYITKGLAIGLEAGTTGFTNGTNAAALFNNPRGICVNTAGTIYASEYSNHAIRKVVLTTTP